MKGSGENTFRSGPPLSPTRHGKRTIPLSSLDGGRLKLSVLPASQALTWPELLLGSDIDGGNHAICPRRHASVPYPTLSPCIGCFVELPTPIRYPRLNGCSVTWRKIKHVTASSQKMLDSIDIAHVLATNTVKSASKRKTLYWSVARCDAKTKGLGIFAA